MNNGDHAQEYWLIAAAICLAVLVACRIEYMREQEQDAIDRGEIKVVERIVERPVRLPADPCMINPFTRGCGGP